ncbi:MAG TPA: hypothetical protein VHJ19_11630, partial [Gammaproteobacteria bacterium]|nr:hypothetical protein [Gammaproteobacteria bacterium]
MHVTEKVDKDITLTKIVESASARFHGSHTQAAEQFARAYFAGVAAEDLLGRSSEDLYGAVHSQWQLTRQRKLGVPNIRVYNPNKQEHGWQSPHTVVEIVTDDMPFLVDSVSMELNRHGLTIHLIIHPVMR